MRLDPRSSEKKSRVLSGRTTLTEGELQGGQLKGERDSHKLEPNRSQANFEPSSFTYKSETSTQPTLLLIRVSKETKDPSFLS